MGQGLGHGHLGQLLDRARAKRSPAGGENHSLHLVPPPRLHGLEDGVMLTVDRQNLNMPLFGQPHDQRTRHDETFFIRQGHRLAGFQRVPSPLQASTSDNSRKHHIDLWIADRSGNSFRSHQHLDTAGQGRAVESPNFFRIGKNDPSRAESHGLIQEQIEIVVGRKNLRTVPPPNWR